MSGFSAEKLSSLDFDFTEIPHKSGEGFCTGKGVMDEPSADRIEAFFASINALRKLVFEAERDKSGKKIKAIEDDAEVILAGMREALSAVGNGSPTVAQLEQLPPRALRAFSDWVQQELTDPKG
jgi:hypothetical protein